MDRDLRRTLLVVATVVVLVAVGRLVIGSVYDTDAVSARIRRHRDALGGHLAERPTDAVLREVAMLRDALEAELDAAREAMAYALPEAFTVPAGKSPDLVYFDVLRREQQALVKGASYQGVPVPANLGMPDVNPTGLEEVLATLRSLHVVHRVVSAALEAGVAAVDDIRIVPQPRRRSGDDGLRLERVDFTMRGGPAALERCLRAVVSGTPYLGLEELVIESIDEDGEELSCRFSAVAVRLEAEPAS